MNIFKVKFAIGKFDLCSLQIFTTGEYMGAKGTLMINVCIDKCVYFTF